MSEMLVNGWAMFEIGGSSYMLGVWHSYCLAQHDTSVRLNEEREKPYLVFSSALLFEQSWKWKTLNDFL